MTGAGRLVLVFDDGYVEDHEQVGPVLAAAGVPACFAVVPAWVGDDGHLDADQVRALADAGHEVAAHGRCHRHLQAFRLDADVSPGDRRLRLDPETAPGGEHGIEIGDRYEMTDGERRETVTLAAVERGPPALVTEAPPGAFDAVATVVRPTRAVLRDEIRGAREALRGHGVDPDTFVFPYDAADTRAWALAREAYATVPNTATRSLPNPPGTPPTNLRRWYLETTHLRPAELDTYLDAVADTGGLGVLGGHSAWDTVPPERVERVVAGARGRGIEVTTFGRL